MSTARSGSAAPMRSPPLLFFELTAPTPNTCRSGASSSAWVRAHDPPLVHHQNEIRVAHRAQAVGDDHPGAAQAGEVVLHGLLGHASRASRLVEDQHLRPPHQARARARRCADRRERGAVVGQKLCNASAWPDVVVMQASCAASTTRESGSVGSVSAMFARMLAPNSRLLGHEPSWRRSHSRSRSARSRPS